MTIARKTYLFGTAVLVFLAASAPVELRAQDDGGGLTCGWCLQVPISLGIYEIADLHGFPYEGGECGWEGSGQGHKCSRCGGDGSSCHFLPQIGPCHIACGPEGDGERAYAEIKEALEDDNMTVVASALLRERAGVSVEFVSGAGRIDLLLPCDPNRPFRTIAVLPEARERLEAELRLSPSVSAIPLPAS